MGVTQPFGAEPEQRLPDGPGDQALVVHALDLLDQVDRVRLANRALAESSRCRVPPPPAGPEQGHGWGELDARMRGRLIGRRFMQDLERVPRWWEGFDPQVVGPSLADGDWATLTGWADSLAAFVAHATQARGQASHEEATSPGRTAR